MSRTVLEPELTDSNTGTGRWMVVIFNNDVTPLDIVIAVLVRATGCDFDEASMEAWEAHHFGKAPVHFASRAECDKAAAIIASVGVQTEVSPEWDD